MKRIGRRQLIVEGGRLLAVGTGVALASPGRAASGTDDRLRELARDVKVVIPRGDPRYAHARLPWNARFDAIKPLAVVLPSTPAEVRAVVRWARSNEVRLAVRSGGHSYAGLSSTTGVVVDLSRISGVQLGQGHRVRIGAGARLGKVYEHLWAARRSIPTGSQPTVGIGGLALGGGQGFASRAYGLTCDRVRAIEIVTPDGKLRSCSAGQQPDLFWALRGAGAGSFGIVTALTLDTFAVGTVTTFNVEWPWAAAAEVLDAWQAFMRTAPDELSCVLALRVPATTGGTPHIALNGQLFGSAGEASAALASLTAVGAPLRVNVLTRPFNVAVKYFAGGLTTRARLAAKSAFAKKSLSPAGIDTLVDAVEEKHADPRLRGGGVVLFGYGGAINRVPRGKTAFVHRDALFSLEYATLWAAGNTALEQPSVRWLRDVRAAMVPYVSGEAVQNYADAELSGWKKAYYGENLPRLVRVKRRYDPSNMFRHALSIPTHL